MNIQSIHKSNQHITVYKITYSPFKKDRECNKKKAFVLQVSLSFLLNMYSTLLSYQLVLKKQRFLYRLSDLLQKRCT